MRFPLEPLIAWLYRKNGRPHQVCCAARFSFQDWCQTIAVKLEGVRLSKGNLYNKLANYDTNLDLLVGYLVVQ